MSWLRRGQKQPRAPIGMVRETFGHAAVYSGASILARTISFFMLPFYAHILRDIGYGVIGMIDASIVLLGSLFGANFAGAIMRIYHQENSEQDKQAAVTTGTALVVVILLPIILLGAAISKPTASLLLGSDEYWSLICIAYSGFLLDMVSQSARSILVIRRRSSLFSLLSLLHLFVGLSANILLVVVLRWGLQGYFIAGLVSHAFSASISLIVLFRHCAPRWDGRIAKQLLTYQLPMIPGYLASFVAGQIERILVRFQLEIAALGVLEMAYKFPVLINILIMEPFTQSWSTKRLEIADEPGAPAMVGRMFVYFLFISMFGYMLLAANIQTVLHLLTPPEFWPAARIAQVDGLQIVMRGVALHLIFGLFYAKHTGVVAKLRVWTAFAKVGISYVMITVWGLYGAAWAGLIVTTIYGVVGFFLARRRYRMIISWRRVMLVVAVATTILVLIDQLTTEAIAAWGRPVLEVVSTGVGKLAATPLAEIKDGKLLVILEERLDLVFDLLIRSLLVCGYLAIAPLVHEESLRKVQKLARQARGLLVSGR